MYFFSVNAVEERPWWPIKSPKNGRKKGQVKRRERDQIKFIALRFERWQVVNSGKQEGKIFHQLHVLAMNDDLWDGVRGLSYRFYCILLYFNSCKLNG